MIHVNVVSAKNLTAMDRNGFSDPYVKVRASFSNQEFKTKVIPKSLTPNWDQTFCFFTTKPTGTLKVQIWDKDTWTRDDFLGIVEIPLDHKCIDSDKWYHLEEEPKKKDLKKDLPGEVHIKIEYKLPLHKSDEDDKGNLTDSYILGKELGRGGFSVVRNATNVRTKEKVAVKCIQKSKLNDTELTLLNREIDIMNKLKHPNIIQLVDVFENEDFVFLVLELIQGGELYDRIISKGTFTEKNAAQIVKQIFSALAYMHDNGVAHRDMKPENLLCVEKGAVVEHVKIADFGLSKEYGSTSKLQTTCGSPAYVAPEVLMCYPYGNECDIWSVGVILYILLCGFAPFRGDTEDKLFDNILKGRWTFPSCWNNISEDAKDLVTKMLSLNPAERPTAFECLHHKWIKEATGRELPTLSSMRDMHSAFHTYFEKKGVKRGVI